MAKQELGNDASVLQAHYARNRTPKAPNPSRIQCSPSVNPLPPPPQQENTNASCTLSSYPPQWQEVICYAKQSFRAYVAGKNGFPDALTGVQEARECLEDALAVHLDDGGIVEPGQMIDRDMIMLVSLSVSVPPNANNLECQVYAESWLLRSQLKTDLRTQVRNLKSLFPDRFTSTAQELQSMVKATVETWVGDGSYLHDVTPGSVRNARTPLKLPAHLFPRTTKFILPIQSSLPPPSYSTSTNGVRYPPMTQTHSKGQFQNPSSR